MKRPLDYLIPVLAGVGLLLAPSPAEAPAPVPAPAPKPAPCPDDECPAPKPLPNPYQPNPSPSPWGAISAAVGPTAPDGTVPQIKLPRQLHIRNTGGSDGAGLCVFASVSHSAHWADVEVLEGLFDWMKRHPGGGTPRKLKRMIERLCEEKGVPVPRYVQFEGDADEALAIMQLACATGRMPACTYYRSPTGRYRGRRISHMVSIAHADEKWVAVLDNNYPGSLEWMTHSEWQRCASYRGNVWVAVLLDNGPPPLALPNQYDSPTPPELPNGYSWHPSKDGSTLGLFYRGRQIGGYRISDGLYFRRQSRGVWDSRPSNPPVPVPPEYGVNFGVDADAIGDSGWVVGAPDDLIPDDAKLPRVTMVGETAEELLKRLSGLPACVVKAYTPNDWEAKLMQLPPVLVQAPGGDVILSLTTWDADAVIRVLRGKPPTPAPEPTPDPAPMPTGDAAPLIVLAALSVIVFLRDRQE